jgi:hypothetical protein
MEKPSYASEKLVYTEDEAASALAMTAPEIRSCVAHGLLFPFREPLKNRMRFHRHEIYRFAMPGVLASFQGSSTR